jgi:hypothetical protein
MISPVSTNTIPIIFREGISSFKRKKDAMAVKTGIRLAKILALAAPNSLTPLVKRMNVIDDPKIARYNKARTEFKLGVTSNTCRTSKIRKNGRKRNIPNKF